MIHFRKKLILCGLLILAFGVNNFDLNLPQSSKNIFSQPAYGSTVQNESSEGVYLKYIQALQNKDLAALKELYALPEKADFDIVNPLIPENVVINRTEINGDKVFIYVKAIFPDNQEVEGRAVLIKDGQSWKFFDQSWKFQSSIKPENIIGIVTPVDEEKPEEVACTAPKEEPAKLRLEKASNFLKELNEPESVHVMYQAQSYITTPPPAPTSPYYTPEMANVPEVLPVPEETIQQIQPDSTPVPVVTKTQETPQPPVEENKIASASGTSLSNNNIAGKIFVSKRDGHGYLRFELLNNNNISFSHIFKIDNASITMNEAQYAVNDLPEGDYILSGTYYFTNKYKEVYHLNCGKRTINLKNGDSKSNVNFYCK